MSKVMDIWQYLDWNTPNEIWNKGCATYFYVQHNSRKKNWIVYCVKKYEL